MNITTTKTAHVALKGAFPTLGELRVLVQQADAARIPNSATVQHNQSQSGGVVNGSLTVTWTAGVDAIEAVPA